MLLERPGGIMSDESCDDLPKDDAAQGAAPIRGLGLIALRICSLCEMQVRAVEAPKQTGAGLSGTLVWYEAPHRLGEMLADGAQAFGPRDAAVARELTKRFEEVRRGRLDALAAHYAANVARGEVTVVVGPAPPESADADDL